MNTRHRMWIFVLASAIALASSAFGAEWIGADLSFVPRLEANGAGFTQSGLERSAPEIFRSAGFNIVRLRLWHTPSEPWHGLDSTVAFAVRAQALGFDVLLDFHYSDSWADPSQQTKPAAWQGLAFSALVDSIRAYTSAVMCRFRDADVVPVAVQLGNEIDPGMLWNDGRVGGVYDTPQQWAQLAALLNAAGAGARDSLPPSEQPELVVHVADGGDSAFCHWYFDHLVDLDVDFDVIGLSYYPWWHGSMSDLESNLTFLAGRYGKDILIAETGYPWTLDWDDDTHNMVGLPEQLLPQYPATPLGQAFFISDVRQIVAALPSGRGRGVCLWEPDWISTPTFGSAWENVALFDFDGAALIAFESYPGLVPKRLTVYRRGDDIELRWADDASPFYRVFSAATSDGPFTTVEGTTTGTVFTVEGVATADSVRFFIVRGRTGP